ncbi:MAG TPA: response regulator [Flavisolibacter sp.]|jgi:CheY-like chemotaxis protein|nr:response regulator [Flavisolibacter sp.]
MASNRIILYAEDDLDDLHVFEMAFEKYPDISIIHYPDGNGVLSYLRSCPDQGAYPCLIVLDMNMPGMDGRTTLKEIKADRRFNAIPVLLFTTSSSEIDRRFALQYNADFITKPIHFEQQELLADKLAVLCSFDQKIMQR